MTLPTSDSITVLGLGPMGMPMAKRLLIQHPGIVVWNRTPSKAMELQSLGATPATSPSEAAREIVLTVLPDLRHVEDLVSGPEGLLAGWKARGVANPVLVVHGTVSPTAVGIFAERMLREHGVRVLDAPVSGGIAGAENGSLSIMVGGEESTALSLWPIFELMGTTVRYMGPSGSGALAKACNQIVVAATITAVSEAMLLARASGLDLAVMQELLRGGLADSQVLRQKGHRWISEDFSGGGSASNQLKDLRFIIDAANYQGLNLPVTNATASLFNDMVKEGNGQLDHTGIYQSLSRNVTQ
ncbi:2-hydroxy-3-oxopropionate reductase [Arthrobacter sp. PAMC 25486]|uniref:NAD(P)-dependent oxidoreductase n=1 Tax=Arthrobacter sp. PAMC 25486 TaxID=1494608 RepID=UPI000535B509|nr:NAD(P)-dependent oxidoreductase [Arthrobacter sp. PAMC 25486]AIY02959.1 2-hydroxy-3-oxopropionate reductase [Arthrobacter sp. PAMC 25486]